MSKPDWSKAPWWAEWWAMDEDGACYWYESKPVPTYFDEGGSVWEASSGMTQPMPIHKDWDKSLEERPSGS